MQQPRILGNDIEIVSRIGAGGGGGLDDVYRGRQLSTGIDCVVKVTSDPKRGLAVLREARILARVPSDHIPHLLQIGDSDVDGVQWFAQILLHGENLQHVVSDRALDSTVAINIIFEICNALDAAHRRGIVHCNLKPNNVILVPSKKRTSSAYLLGFYIAKWSLAAEDPFEGQLVGTPAFMAPEQLQSRDLVTPATDVWALGLLAFYLLTGRDYWLSGDFRGIFYEVLNSSLDRASERAKHLGCSAQLPLWFDDWFDACISRDATRRFATAGEAAEALREYHEGVVWKVAFPESDAFSPELAVLELRTIVGDPSLRLLRIERGSIILVLKGSPGSFKKIQSLMTRDALPHIAGAPVLGLERCDESRSTARPQQTGAIDAFISYSPKDISFCDELLVHLSMMRRQGLINEWYDALVTPGSATAEEVGERLARCELFMTLLSADYIASDKCYQRELEAAMEKHRSQTGYLVPIIVRACDWEHPPFSYLSTLPQNGTPLASWTNRDEGWAEVVRDIRPVVKRLRERRTLRDGEAL